MFMFYFENVDMRGKEEEEKYIESIAYHLGNQLIDFFEKFTNSGELSQEEMKFSKVKSFFIEHIYKKSGATGHYPKINGI